MHILAWFWYFQDCMVLRAANNCFLTYKIILFTITLSSMTLFCSGFEHVESKWILSMYPDGRHLSSSKVSLRLLSDHSC